MIALSTGVSISWSSTGIPSSRRPRAIDSDVTWLPLVNSDERAAGGADPLEHLDRAGLGVGAAVGTAVRERPVDVEHEPAHILAAVRQARRHTTVSSPSWVSSKSEMAGRRASSGAGVTSGLRPGRAAGAGAGLGVARRDHRVDLLAGHGQAQQQLLLGDPPAEPLTRAVEADRLQVAQLARLRPRQDAVGDHRDRPGAAGSP